VFNLTTLGLQSMAGGSTMVNVMAP
jgi:hypothetical protein